MCHKIKTYTSGPNYYRLACTEKDCSFQIIYSLRTTEKKIGYYLLNSTCLTHKPDCPNSIACAQNTKSFRFLATQILPLFENKIPTLDDVRQCLKCSYKEDFTKEQIKYIRRLAKTLFFHKSSDIIPEITKFCENLVSVHQWKYHVEFFESMITAIVLFPPWVRDVLPYYHSPLIVDATFSNENLRFLTAAVIDGEVIIFTLW